MNKKRFAASVTTSLAIIGAGLLYLMVFVRGAAESKMESPDAPPMVKVAVQELATQEVLDTRILTGRIGAWETVTLSAETSGRIESQPTEMGDRVSEDQELIRINTTRAQARRAQAHAEYRLSEQELKRIQGLREQGISSPRELDQARAQRQAAQAALELADIELDQSVISAPFDGVVDHLYQEEGEYVSIGQPLARIIQVDRVKFVIGIPERDLPEFERGDGVLVYVDAYPGRPFSGTIHRIGTSADPSTLTFITEVAVDNADDALKPGLMAKGVLIRATYPEAIAVPLFALIRDGDDRYVFVEKDGVAEKRMVSVGFFENEYIHVTDGLAAGDRLIVVGHRQLHDGTPVEVREVLEQASARPNNPFAGR